MHTEMWEHPAVVDNLALLRRRGVHVVEPATGRLAGGDVGSGRLAEPADIVAAAAAVLAAVPARPKPPEVSPTATARDGSLAGLHAVVTAGGTREPIDPVRFVGNRSSGKQGYAIAASLARRGARVTLITTVALPAPDAVEIVDVETAAEMEAAVKAHEADAQVIVMAAAVADFRPKQIAGQKLKKAEGAPEIILEQTPDILAGLGARRRPAQVLVGFAAETAAPDQASDQLREYAMAKLSAKGADLVVANDVAAPGVGFAHDTNAVLIVGRGGFEMEVPLATKAEVAEAVVTAITQIRARYNQETP
jgi:phosphopantothenoylcysteine decarboxylase/phosphopantothenate--cysteine ligase